MVVGKAKKPYTGEDNPDHVPNAADMVNTMDTRGNGPADVREVAPGLFNDLPEVPPSDAPVDEEDVPGVVDSLADFHSGEGEIEGHDERPVTDGSDVSVFETRNDGAAAEFTPDSRVLKDGAPLADDAAVEYPEGVEIQGDQGISVTGESKVTKGFAKADEGAGIRDTVAKAEDEAEEAAEEAEAEAEEERERERAAAGLDQE
jgi:hypothetical protein